ncbi:MAG: magnesium-translocating P-type ATPase [Cyanobacteria bacterium RYN_339]|nr:magnesium-translocating P-type ATPase [Cyanobacteria bacterium RYN_339]
MLDPMQTDRAPEPPFWSRPLAGLVSELGAGPEGLAGKEARQRLARYGPNRTVVHEAGLGQALLGQLANPLVLTLLAAAALSAGFGEGTNAIVISAIIALSVALNVAQSFRSRQAVAALHRQGATTTCVLRDGQRVALPLDEIVPGDVLELAAGDLVPADARLLEARDVFVDQAALTGESLPAEKQVGELLGPLGLDQAGNSVFAGTSLVSGLARALVVRTGAATAIGAVAVGLARKPPPTEFERGMAAFSSLILRATLGLVVFAFLVVALVRHQPLEAFMFAIALAVGLTPEFLPLIVAVTLGRGAMAMARHGVIVKQLQAIENFGSIDVLCSDKTGTLTEGRMALDRAVDAHGEPSPLTLAAASLNAAHETGIKSAIDEAIQAAHAAEPGWTKLDELPFDFHRRRVSVVLERAGARQLITKGALEGILPECTRYLAGEAAHPLDAAARTLLEATHTRLGAEGLRVLAVARRDVPTQAVYGPDDEAGLTFLGFLALIDPPRVDAAAAIKALAADGVRTVILTGDNEGVTGCVCRSVGLPLDRIMLGTELDQVRDEALVALVTRIDVFARVSPEQKVRVVHALKQAHHVVGFMGDGINDGPALRAADVGISVESGADVAKAAAAIILARPGLEVLHRGVLEGRRSFANVTKYVLMGTSSNFGNMFSMAGAAVLLPFLPMLPTQILLNNLLYDMSQLAIPGDQVDAVDAARPRRWDIAFVQRFMLHVGPVSSVFDFLTFGWLYFGFHAGAALFQTAWFVESLLTQTLVIFVIRTKGRPWASRPSAALAANVLVVCAVAVALPYTHVAGWLGLVPLPAPVLGAIALTVAGYLLATEWAKRRFYASLPGR